MKLHRRIYLHFLAVLLVVGAATSVVFALTARDAFLREVVERITRHVASLAGEALADPRGLGARLAQLHRDLEVDLTVRDLDGRVLASAGAALPTLSATETAEVRAGKMIAHPWPRRYAVVLVRDPASGTPRALLTVSPIRRAPLRGFLFPGVIVAVVLGVVAVATVPLTRRIARPIEQLTAAARRFGAGDLASRVAIATGRRHRRRDDELTQLAEAFNEMATRVEQIVRGQKELLANVSHELRSPLTRIQMALELLPRDAASGARFAALERDLDDFDRLIEDVLTTTRLETTGLPTALGPVDVRAMLDDLADRARGGGAGVGVDAPAVTLVADGLLLRRALWNLVENAVKYGAPPLTLSAAQAGACVALTVSDEGEGIAVADRERVFAPFVRGDRAHAARGVGLGLTLARRVAEVHGGTITVESATAADGRERGCRVVLRLPFSPSSVRASP